MKRIKYICYYPGLDTLYPRECGEAATTKIDYIISVLNRNGIAVDVISPAIVSSSLFSFSRGGMWKSGDNSFRLFPSFSSRKIALLRRIGRAITDTCFHLWLKRHVVRSETIIVYHSLGYCSWFLRFKKTRQVRIIGEIEEIYQDVHLQSKKLSSDEYAFLSICDSFILPNTVLNEIVNQEHKNYWVIHGVYSIQPRIAHHFDDKKIHVLYSGTFDSVKGGTIAAIDAATYLSDNYVVHITGFGTERDTADVKERISRVSDGIKARIIFHGFISRDDLSVLMQQCHIGLCTQDPTTELNLTSFPSKILYYMSNGLFVISGRNRAIEESAVGDLVYYYDEQTPQAIARAISCISVDYDNAGINRLRLLDEEVVRGFSRIVREFF